MIKFVNKILGERELSFSSAILISVCAQSNAHILEGASGMMKKIDDDEDEGSSGEYKESEGEGD